MPKIRNLQDVVDWGLCIGCGACAALCGETAVTLVDRPGEGIRPRFLGGSCGDLPELLPVCPGFGVDAGSACGLLPAGLPSAGRPSAAVDPLLLGPALEIWEGCAADPEIRFAGSSGGMLTALSLYCLEQEGAGFVLHTAMDPGQPWRNRTVRSRSRAELLAAAGSRYAASSPCEGLGWIEESGPPCVFVGKPCDVAAVRQVRRLRPRLDARLGLVLTFFCAGTPATEGTLRLMERLGVAPSEAKEVHYRGRGWPGRFRVERGEGREESLSYLEAWGSLQAHRPLRCHLCPDGLGQLADLSCGDAWLHFRDDGNPGLSLVLVRTERGRQVLRAAAEEGYVRLEPSGAGQILEDQAPIRRRRELHGRLLARRMMLLPVPRYRGFALGRAWRLNPPLVRLRVVLGTLRRIIQRRQWRRRPPVR